MNDTLNSPETIQKKKANMGQFFSLNKLAKKKRSIESRIDKLNAEKKLIQEQINSILKNTGIINNPIVPKVININGLKVTREQQIANVLSEKGPMTLVEIANILNTNAQNCYQVAYRGLNKVFKRDGNQWSLMERSEQNSI